MRWIVQIFRHTWPATALFVSLAIVVVASGEPTEKDLGSGAAIDANTFKDPREILVPGTHDVDVMELTAPLRTRVLLARFKAAMQANPDWWSKYVEEHAEERPLPYHPNFGLTKAEYDEIGKGENGLTAEKRADAKLTIMEKRPGVLVLNGNGDLPDLLGVEIDLNKDLVRTRYGDLTERSETNASESTALGAWKGVGWKLNSVDLEKMTGAIAKFHVGRVTASGRNVIYYDVKELTPDGRKRLTNILLFDVSRK